MTVRSIIAFLSKSSTLILRSSVSFMTFPLNPLTTDDTFWRRQILAACYQLPQSVLKIGSVLAERVGQGEVGESTALPGSAWWRLQLPVVASPNVKLCSGHSHSRNFDQYPYNTHQIEAFRFLFPILLVRTCISKILACNIALTAF